MTALILPTAIALLAFVMATIVVRRYPLVGLGSVGLMIIILWEVPHPPAIVTVSGLAVYPADVITLVLFAVGVLQASQLRANLKVWIVPWWSFGLLIAVSTLLGVAAFGPGTAVNEARPFLHFFFAMTWVLATRPDRLRLRRISLILGWALVLIALYHGVRYGVGNAVSVLDSRGTGRILVSGQAMALLLCAGTVYLGSAGSREARRRSTFSSIVFLGVVVLAQHRSVWVATAFGTVAVLIWSARGRTRNQVAVLLLVGTWLALLGWSFGLESPDSGLFESASNAGTLNWRTSGWQSLVSQAFAQGPAVVIGGEPFGSGFLRQLNTGRWATTSPHNWYVTVFLRVGIIGLALLALMLISAVAKARAMRAEWTFLLVAVGAYGLFYMVDWYLAPWLGAAMIVSLGGLRQIDHLRWNQESRATDRTQSRATVGSGIEEADALGVHARIDPLRLGLQ